jgi:hypothetical protein
LRPQLFKWVVKPVFCTVIATLISHFLFNRVFPRQEMNAAGLTLHIAATVVIYVALVRLTGTFDREDSAWLASVFKG